MTPLLLYPSNHMPTHYLQQTLYKHTCKHASPSPNQVCVKHTGYDCENLCAVAYLIFICSECERARDMAPKNLSPKIKD